MEQLRLVDEDGCLYPLDLDGIEQRLKQACASSGGQYDHIPGELMPALRMALRHNAEKSGCFKISAVELDNQIASLLCGCGCADVGRRFLQNGVCRQSSCRQINAVSEELLPLLRHHLAPGNIGRIVERVIAAADKLGISRASGQLWIELAAYYCSEEAGINLPVHHEDVTAGELRTLFAPELLSYCETGVVKLLDMLPLFPVLRWQIDLMVWAEVENWHRPLLELELPGLFAPLVNALIDSGKRIDADCRFPVDVLEVDFYFSGQKEFSETFGGKSIAFMNDFQQIFLSFFPNLLPHRS